MPMPKQPKIKLITFDLDNTLWAVDPVIEGAEKALQNWLHKQHPHIDIATRFSTSALNKLRKDIVLTEPLIIHRLTALRKKVLQAAFVSAGYTKESAHTAAQQAFDVFYEARNQVEFFPGVLNTLEILADSYQLGALSNGNACIKKTGLDAYISFHYSAEKIGQAKPHPAMFEAAMGEARAQPHECIHIGDHPDEDILAAEKIGLPTIWVNMFQMSWPYNDKPRFEITHFDQLIAAIQRIDQA